MGRVTGLGNSIPKALRSAREEWHENAGSQVADRLGVTSRERPALFSGRRLKMPKRISDSARILNFFTEGELGSVKVIYELVQDVMRKRLAPEKAVAKARRKKKAEAAAPATTGPQAA